MNSQRNDSVLFSMHGKRVRFFIDEPTDVVQMAQLNGSFYEIETLERIRRVIPEGATIIDAGANVGNHSIYFGLFCKPRRIYPFEPNSHIASILKKNTELNSLSTVDLSHVQFALGNISSQARLVVRRADNWGNGHLIAKGADLGSTVFSELVDIRSIDSFNISDVDFIKIDVEGHEVEVLQGALETIRKFRPVLFVEIGQIRLEVVANMLTALGYQAIDYFCQYRTQFNFLYVPTR